MLASLTGQCIESVHHCFPGHAVTYEHVAHAPYEDETEATCRLLLIAAHGLQQSFRMQARWIRVGRKRLFKRFCTRSCNEREL